MTRIVCFLFLFICPSVWAQEVLNLDQCIERAQKLNVQVLQSKLQVNRDQEQFGETKYQRLPQANFTAGQNVSFGRGLTSKNTYVDRTTLSTNVSVSASLPLFTGFRIPNVRKQAELNLLATEADREKIKNDIGLQVAEAYFQVLFREELIKVAREQVMLSERQHARIKKLYLLGRMAELDVSEAHNRVVQDSMQLVDNENSYRKALLTLSQILEFRSPDSLKILPLENLTPNLGVDGPEIIYQQALNRSPEIQARKYKMAAAEKGIKIARSAYWPTLSLNADLGTIYNKISGITSFAFGKQFHDNFSKAIGVTLVVPLFDRFETRSKVRQAKFNYEGSQLQLVEEKKMLYKNIQNAWYDAISAREKMKSAISAEKVAKATFAMMTKKFELGAANSTQYDEQRTKYINAKSNEISAMYEYAYRIKILNFYRNYSFE